jgi:ectoine hydroxylase-related dioxygenase (phytanoyl-CoA dioxygenase family)
VGEVVSMRRGSVLAMSSLLFHRSGANATQSWRRALLVSYSPEPIVSRSGQPWDRAIPVLRHGRRVDRETAT